MCRFVWCCTRVCAVAGVSGLPRGHMEGLKDHFGKNNFVPPRETSVTVNLLQSCGKLEQILPCRFLVCYQLYQDKFIFSRPLVDVGQHTGADLSIGDNVKSCHTLEMRFFWRRNGFILLSPPGGAAAPLYMWPSISRRINTDLCAFGIVLCESGATTASKDLLL